MKETALLNVTGGTNSGRRSQRTPSEQKAPPQETSQRQPGSGHENQSSNRQKRGTQPNKGAPPPQDSKKQSRGGQTQSKSARKGVIQSWSRSATNSIEIPKGLSKNIRLSNNEAVLGVVQYRWWTWLGTLLLAATMVIGGIYLFGAYPDVVIDIIDPDPGDEVRQSVMEYESQVKSGALLSVIWGFVLFAWIYIRQRGSGFVITDQRIVRSKRGLFNSRSKEVRMEDIRSIETAGTGALSIFQGGGIRVKTGAGQLDIPAADVNNLSEVIRGQKNKHNQNRKVKY